MGFLTTASMKKLSKSLAVIAIGSLGLVSVSSQAAIYDIDPDHTHARFTVDHFGTTTNAGGFYGLKGTVEYSPEKKKGFIGITIPVANLTTNIKAFDKHLKSPDFFDIEKYPTAYFKSTNWQFDGDKVTAINGELTMVGKTHPVTLKATKFNCYDNPILKTKSCGGDFETTIDRTRWGINTFTDGGMMKDVTLKIQVEAGLRK